MKLRNKKTWEIVPASNIAVGIGNDGKWYDSLAELNEEWEDYEEPKEYWYIDWTPEIGVYYTRDVDSDADKRQKEIGNYFETREEAEKAVEKLKAWKRLKDNEVKFEGWKRDERYCGDYIIKMTDQSTCNDDDLDLLFGGEE